MLGKMKNLIIVLSITFLFGIDLLSQNKDVNWLNKSEQNYNLYYSADNTSSAESVAEYVSVGIKAVETYFAKPFKNKFDVYVFPSRKDLDEQWGKDWGVQDFKSECWMIASGVAHRLDLLDPQVWKTDACEHNPDDKNHIQKLITHELVHVYHGQSSPIPDFTGMENLGWFIEGLAVLVSGQMDSTRVNSLTEAKEQNKLPADLKTAWSGKYRYAVCGSLVNFIEKKYGKEIIKKLLPFTKEEEILEVLDINQNKLLDDWKITIPIK